MTTQSLAYRVGSALGVIARALLHARKPGIRWMKRGLVLGGLFWVFIANLAWIMGITMSILAFIGVAYIVAKADYQFSPDSAPGGYDVLGQPLDEWGNPVD